MSKFLFYIVPLAIILLLIPEMDLSNTIIILLTLIHIFFQIGAILSIANEEILYSSKEKFLRILLVLFIPILGIVIEYVTARKYDKKNHETKGGEDTTTGGSGYFTGFGGGMMNSSDSASGGGD